MRSPALYVNLYLFFFYLEVNILSCDHKICRGNHIDEYNFPRMLDMYIFEYSYIPDIHLDKIPVDCICLKG